MDYLTWLLTFAVVGYAAALTIKTGGALHRYRKVKDRVERVDAEISDWLDLNTVKHKGNKVPTFYPVYACTISGNEKRMNGVVRIAGNPYEIKGTKVVLLYDRETEELWCEKDLPLMVKQIKVRLVTVASLLLLMILTSVML